MSSWNGSWAAPSTSRCRIGQIRFFPDGSSTGGRIGLSRNDRRAAVAVDWLTGLVSVDDAPE
jgi:hypothetical protein